ncbi:hypothetical protein [Streptomyces sp. NPDC005349]|uniref:hypothetical protein n=1 Tax=unclassified Streptomyces TaxID=2593676 RepID=UPI0033B62D5E
MGNAAHAVRWRALDGSFERMLAAAQAGAAGEMDWLVSVDFTVVAALQHAAGARKEGLAPPASHALGAD